MKFGLQIEPTNRCNLKCQYCNRPDFIQKIGDMDVFALKKAIHRDKKYLQKALRGTISLTGWGEPLLHPGFASFVTLFTLESVNLPIGFTTNAVLLDGEILDFLAESFISHLAISIDHAPIERSWLLHNWVNGWSFSLRSPLSRPFILVANKIMQPDFNLEFLEWFRNIRFNILNFIPFNPERHEDEETYVKMFLARYGSQLKYRLFEENTIIVSPFHRDRWVKRAERWKRRYLTHSCAAPVFINWQGLVSPCCLLTHSTWGNMFLRPLKEIVGRMFTARRQWAHYCNHCNFWH